MLNFPDFYKIVIETDEYHTHDVEPFATWEEAMAARMRYANWYSPNGDVWIYKISGKSLRDLEHWHIKADGSIASHYDWSK
jgi:hypothetical protein